MFSVTFLGGVLLAQKDVDLEPHFSYHLVSETETGSKKIANHHSVIEKSVEDMGVKKILQKCINMNLLNLS